MVAGVGAADRSKGFVGDDERPVWCVGCPVDNNSGLDEIEGAPPASGVTLRLALEVDDTWEAVALSEGAGMATIAPPVETPFRTINARVQGPAGWQVTFFQELETLEERTAHDGFTTDDQR